MIININTALKVVLEWLLHWKRIPDYEQLSARVGELAREPRVISKSLDMDKYWVTYFLEYIGLPSPRKV